MSMRRLPWAAAFALLLSGCTATAMTLMEFAGTQDAVIPAPATLQGELKGRALEVGTVSMNPWPRTGPGTLKLPDAAYVRLLDDQLRKAFAVADLEKGSTPAYRVNAIIEVARFTDGGAFFPLPSLLQVTMQVERPDGSKAMQGRFIARGNVVSVPVSTNGMIWMAAVPWPGGAVRDLSLAVPAMADTMAHVGLGLRNGVPLEAIEISAQDDVSVIQPAAVLRDSRLGMRSLSEAELRTIGGAELP
jgi:hypothetical protein